jgi:hypothetical protein
MITKMKIIIMNLGKTKKRNKLKKMKKKIEMIKKKN